MPTLQTSGGLCYFLRDHLGHPIPSPALFRPMHDRFVNAIKAYAMEYAVPLVAFEPRQDKDALVATYRARFPGHDGVVIIGVAQEKARAFKAHKRCGSHGGVTFDFTRQSVAVNHYYFICRPRLGTRLYQDRHVCTVPDQDLSERPRVGETTTAARADSVHQSR
jgi:hypothetical protein